MTDKTDAALADAERSAINEAFYGVDTTGEPFAWDTDQAHANVLRLVAKIKADAVAATEAERDEWRAQNTRMRDALVEVTAERDTARRCIVGQNRALVAAEAARADAEAQRHRDALSGTFAAWERIRAEEWRIFAEVTGYDPEDPTEDDPRTVFEEAVEQIREAARADAVAAALKPIEEVLDGWDRGFKSSYAAIAQMRAALDKAKETGQ